MDKPTCESCPYWKWHHEKDYHDRRIENDIIGLCCIRSPDETDYPERYDNEFCGEHPQFPAYLESLKRPEPGTQAFICKSCNQKVMVVRDGYCNYCYHPGGPGALDD